MKGGGDEQEVQPILYQPTRHFSLSLSLPLSPFPLSPFSLSLSLLTTGV